MASAVEKVSITQMGLPALHIYKELLFSVLPIYHPVCDSLPPAHVYSMGQSLHRRAFNIEHRAEPAFSLQC